MLIRLYQCPLKNGSTTGRILRRMVVRGNSG
jgi:hypothetical protein